MSIVWMGVNGKTIDVTGQFDDVTGQHNMSLTYIIREKRGGTIAGSSPINEQIRIYALSINSPIYIGQCINYFVLLKIILSILYHRINSRTTYSNLLIQLFLFFHKSIIHTL